MLIKVTVFITAISFVLVLVTTFRQKMSEVSTLEKKPEFPEYERDNFSERIYNLPIPQLEHKLNELNRRKNLVMNNFLAMRTSDQQEVIIQVKEIKEKMKAIEEAIKTRRYIK